MTNNENIKALIIIVNAGFSDEAMDVARKCGATGGTILNARGTNNSSKSFLGVHVAPEKEMIISVVTEEVSNKIINEISNGESLKLANGICFCMPIDNVTSINKLA